MADEATKRMVGFKSGKNRTALILAFVIFMRHNAYADLSINKLNTLNATKLRSRASTSALFSYWTFTYNNKYNSKILKIWERHTNLFLP